MSNKVDDDVEILDAPSDIEDMEINNEIDLLTDRPHKERPQKEKDQLAFLVGLTYQMVTIKKSLVPSIISECIVSQDHVVRSLAITLGAFCNDPNAVIKPNKFYFIGQITEHDIIFFVSHPILGEFAECLKQSEDNKATSWLGSKLLSIAENVVVRRPNNEENL